jgi:hypothetical protein
LKRLKPGHSLRSFLQERLQRCHLLRQLEHRAAVILQGQGPVSNPAERLNLAQFCRYYRRYHSAVRLYRAVLTLQPALADDLVRSHRYEAACCAALAATGQGLDAGPLTAQDKTELRRQALAWLRADLRCFTQTVADFRDGGKTASPPEKVGGQAQAPEPTRLLLVCDRLSRWQTGPDLAALREDKELALLPAAEQQDWHKFWTDVRALDLQARGSFAEWRLIERLATEYEKQVHEVKLQAGKMYVFDLESTAFDAFLRLEGANGNVLAENDDLEPTVNLNSRIIFTAPQDGIYQLIATSSGSRGAGDYMLTIRQFAGKKVSKSSP